MTRAPTLLFLAVLLAASIPIAAAQASRPSVNMTLAQAERAAADLKQGMTLQEVQKLLGKPRRTALSTDGMFASTPSQKTLQWTYSWGGSSEDSLRIQFAAKSPEDWHVSSWQWSNY